MDDANNTDDFNAFDGFDMDAVYDKDVLMTRILDRNREAIKQWLRDEFPELQIMRADARVYPEEQRWEIAVDVSLESHEYAIVVSPHDPERAKSPYKASDGVDVRVTTTGTEVLLAVMHEGTVGVQLEVPGRMRPADRLVVATTVRLCALVMSVVTGKRKYMALFIETATVSLRRELKKRAERN